LPALNRATAKKHTQSPNSGPRQGNSRQIRINDHEDQRDNERRSSSDKLEAEDDLVPGQLKAIAVSVNLPGRCQALLLPALRSNTESPIAFYRTLNLLRRLERG